MRADTTAVRPLKALQRALRQSESATSSTKRNRALENRHFLLVEEISVRPPHCRELLEKAGAEVLLERHAMTGVVVALSMPERFDALILDLKLPLLEIAEAGIALRSAGFDRPIIALVSALPGKARRSLEHAGCNIIPKNSAIASAFVSLVAGFIHPAPAALY
jgi:CheY-like chemotaxis protein